MNKFPFADTIILEDDMVLLRPLLISDKESLLIFSETEQDLWKYSMVQAIGAEGLTAYIRLATEARNDGKEYAFIVFDKRTQRYAGSTRFYDIQWQQGYLQLGYTWYGKAFQRTGLNRHCKFLLLSYVFETLGMERVEFRADYENKHSIAAMKKIGCVEEGILRSNGIRADGSRRDSIVLSILRKEWMNGGKDALAKMIG